MPRAALLTTTSLAQNHGPDDHSMLWRAGSSSSKTRAVSCTAAPPTTGSVPTAAVTTGEGRTSWPGSPISRRERTDGSSSSISEAIVSTARLILTSKNLLAPLFSTIFPVFPWTFGRVSWIPGVQTLKMGERWGKMGKKWVKNEITGLQKTALMHASAGLAVHSGVEQPCWEVGEWHLGTKF